MKIELQQVSKRYNYDWIFRNISYSFQSGTSYAITGHNGSGKSTLIKILSGQLSPSSGIIHFYKNSSVIASDAIYKDISLCAPYLELIEEFTLQELIAFNTQFKPVEIGTSISDIVHSAGLQQHLHKQVKHYSSGMKQRVKLILACIGNSEIILFDEPTTNLDNDGVDWYLHLIKTITPNKLLIIASNSEREYAFCNQVVNIQSYK